MNEPSSPGQPPVAHKATIFEHVPHPRIAARKASGPAKTATAIAAVHGTSRAGKFNARVAVMITSAVGSMWCAYVFCVLALLSLPYVLSLFHAFHSTFPAWLIKVSILTLIAWVAHTFLQLVLLPIIIVGQNVQAAASDQRAEDTYKDAEAVLHEAIQIQAHLQAHADILQALIAQVRPSRPGSA